MTTYPEFVPMQAVYNAIRHIQTHSEHKDDELSEECDQPIVCHFMDELAREIGPRQTSLLEAINGGK